MQTYKLETDKILGDIPSFLEPILQRKKSTHKLSIVDLQIFGKTFI